MAWRLFNLCCGIAEFSMIVCKKTMIICGNADFSMIICKNHVRVTKIKVINTHSRLAMSSY